MSFFFGFSRPATKMLRLKEKGCQIEYLTVADIRERLISWIHPSFLVVRLASRFGLSFAKEFIHKCSEFGHPLTVFKS